jgi:hypothetical protein
MLSLSCYKIHLLKINRLLYKRILIGFTKNLAFSNSLFSCCTKLLSPKIRVSSVYIPTTIKASLVVVINKHGLYKEGSIYSFLW